MRMPIVMTVIIMVLSFQPAAALDTGAINGVLQQRSAEDRERANAELKRQSEAKVAPMVALKAKMKAEPGWYKSVEEVAEVLARIDRMRFMPFVRDDLPLDLVKAMAAGVSIDITALRTANQAEIDQRYPGSTFSTMSGGGVIVADAERYTFRRRKCVQIDFPTADGLHRTIAFGDDVTTYRVTDGVASIIAELHMQEPDRSRIVDAVLPKSVQSGISQACRSHSATPSRPDVVGLLESFYRDQLVKSGETMQALAAGMLTSADIRVAFQNYCRGVAASGPMKQFIH